jgi:GrpB-like predicted nucleotidyltransferase (UPF0157 family)
MQLIPPDVLGWATRFRDEAAVLRRCVSVSSAIEHVGSTARGIESKDVVDAAGAEWHRRTAFRDALRDDEALRTAYVALKRDIAGDTDDWSEYTARKSAFVREVVGRSMEPTRSPSVRHVQMWRHGGST